MPSDEALELARLADDTLEAFEAHFGTRLTWKHPYPGMFQDQELKVEALVLELLKQAYVARVQYVLNLRMHEAVHARSRAEQREDFAWQEEYRQQHLPDYTKLIGGGMNKVIREFQDSLHGKKHVDDTPESRAERERIARRLLGDIPRSEGDEGGSTTPEPASNPSVEPPPDEEKEEHVY